MTNVSFEDVKANVSIVQGLQKLGIDGLKIHNAQLRGKCPLCADQGDRKFVVTPAKGLFYSFCCQQGGDVITLASKVKGVSLRDAAAWLSGDTAPAKAPVPQEQGRSQPTTSGFKPLDYLEPEHDAVYAIGLNPTFAKRVGIGYAGKGVARGSVLIPVRDEQGTLEGYIGIQEASYLPRDFQMPENVIQLQKKA